MPHRLTRRDWLKLIGGSAAGLLLTPIPWKILDDTAKWTQNWSWTPTPRRGKVSYKHSTCSLCPMACGVRVRCVGDTPVSLSGVPGHPVSDGALCEIGIAGHLLRYHPARLTNSYKRVTGPDATRLEHSSVDEITTIISNKFSSGMKGSVAILDTRPERTISYFYRRFLSELDRGFYIVPPDQDGISVEATDGLLHTGELSFAFDVPNARTILSFGSPVLDGWGTRRQFASLVTSSRARGETKIIQVESVHSRTAQLADEWIPIGPGTEAVLALAIMNVLIEENLIDTEELEARSSDFAASSERSLLNLAGKFKPALAQNITKISADRIKGLARKLAADKPALAVFGGNAAAGQYCNEEQQIFLGLNLLLGNLNKHGGMVPRRATPGPFSKNAKLAPVNPLAAIPDHSIDLLIMDVSGTGNILPWNAIERKLASHGSIVVGLASYFDGLTGHANYLIPIPSYLETYDDMPTPAATAEASFCIAKPLLPAPETAIHPLDFVKKLASALGRSDRTGMTSLAMTDLLQNRMERIYSENEGRVFDPVTGKSRRLSSISKTEFFTILNRGGCWTDDTPVALRRIHYSFSGDRNSVWNYASNLGQERKEAGKLLMLPVGDRCAEGAAQSNPMMCKVTRESGLRTSPGTIRVNPASGKERGLHDGHGAIVSTDAATMKAEVRFDSSVMPGILEAAIGPVQENRDDRGSAGTLDLLDLCRVKEDLTWRVTPAKISPV